MAEFEKAIQRVLDNEGGLVHDTSDPGGLTNFGISQRSYPDVNIAALTREEACEIYKRDFWDKGRFSEIRDQGVAGKLFDMSVNMGTYRAVMLAQQAVNNLLAGNAEDVVVDGKIGDKTIKGLNLCHSGQLHQELREIAEEFYTDLAARKPAMRKFLTGWLNRARQ